MELQLCHQSANPLLDGTLATTIISGDCRSKLEALLTEGLRKRPWRSTTPHELCFWQVAFRLCLLALVSVLRTRPRSSCRPDVIVTHQDLAGVRCVQNELPRVLIIRVEADATEPGAARPKPLPLSSRQWLTAVQVHWDPCAAGMPCSHCMGGASRNALTRPHNGYFCSTVVMQGICPERKRYGKQPHKHAQREHLPGPAARRGTQIGAAARR